MIEEDSEIKLIVGLGNPGRKYVKTRHNVGFMVLDKLADELGVSFAKEPKFRGELGKEKNCMLLKPTTFMNLSGGSVNGLAKFYKINPESCVVVYDEVAFPLGKLKLRPKGSAGGHNGMKSIIEHFGVSDFPRMRVGIGAGEGAMTDHVLGRFRADEGEVLTKTVEKAANALKYALDRGWQAAMNEYNTSPPKEAEASLTEFQAEETHTNPSQPE